MEQIITWYLSDQDSGEGLDRNIRRLGLEVHSVNGLNMSELNIDSEKINIFIFDFAQLDSETIIEVIKKDIRIQGCFKLCIFTKKQIKAVADLSYNILHIEFLPRPVDSSMFLLLFEKSILVERYRKLMFACSRETESQMESIEGVMGINRKNVFKTGAGKDGFSKIMEYEQKIVKEQKKLKKAIDQVAPLDPEELFDMRRRVDAEDMLASLRRKEMLNDKETINAQESVIDYSSHMLHDTLDILEASEKVIEFGRQEALNLHEELKREKKLNQTLSGEIERLLEEIRQLKAEESRSTN